MIRTITAIIFFVFYFNQSMAQNMVEVSGTLTDRTENKAVPFTTVSLMDTLKTKPVLSTFSDESGKFILPNIKPGTYYISVKSIGYSDFKSSIFSVLNQPVDLGILILEKSSKDLKEVTVSATKQLLEIESDKMIYNVENDETLEGQMALDALKKLPFVTVDAEDNIQMKGSSNFKILLNGKSTSLVAKNPSEALKSFPAALIKRIEVITEPSAKYDAEGTAGIINIITHKKVIGHNGSIYANYSNRGRQHAGGSLNVKWGKFGFSTYIGANTYNMVNQTSSDYSRVSKVPNNLSTLNQHSTSNRNGGWYWGNLELAYDFDTLHTLSVYASPNGGSNKSTSIQNTEILDSALNVTQAFNTYVTNNANYPTYDIGLDFIKRFKDNENHQLSFTSLREESKNDSRYNSIQDYTNFADVDISNTNDSKNTEYTFNLDYTKPFKNKAEWEAGSKLILRHMFSDYRMLQRSSATEKYFEVPENTNTLEYDQNVGSAYMTFNQPIKKFKLKLGARVEQTWIDANFNQDSSAFKDNYINFIPTASLSTKLKKIHTVRLNYSKRIQRPWMNYLNPYVNNQDPRNISFGNPNLDPEKTHSVSLSYNAYLKGNSIDLTLSNAFTDGVITSFTTVESDGIAYTSYYNIAKSNTTGLNLSFWGSAFKKLKIWVSMSTSYVNITHKLDASRNRSGFTNRAHGNLTWSFKNNFSTTFGGWAWQGAPTLQSTMPLYYNYNLALRKSFFKKKLNVGLVANNFLEKTQTRTTVTEDPTFSSYSNYNNLMFRNFSVSASFSFGKLKENVSRKIGVSNDDIKKESDGK